MIRPAVRELRVIEVESSVGAGTPGDPVRRVKDYYQGEEHLFRVDPCLARKEEAAPVMAPPAPTAATTAPILEAINQLRRAVSARVLFAFPSVAVELDEASFMGLKEEVRPLLQFRSGVKSLAPGVIEISGVRVTCRK